VQSADRSKSHCVAPGRPSMAKACTTTSTFVQPFPHTFCLHHSPDRRVRYRDLWRRSCGRPSPCCTVQHRNPNNCARYVAAWDVRPRELRLPTWIDRRAVAHLPGFGAIGLWPFDRANGKMGCRCVSLSESRGSRRTDCTASDEGDANDRTRSHIRELVFQAIPKMWPMYTRRFSQRECKHSEPKHTRFPTLPSPRLRSWSCSASRGESSTLLCRRKRFADLHLSSHHVGR